ncbi:TonB-dependent receptor domain-containing protein [Pulveribacter sp.]|uniref:TonB-dependent receptor domain-containing protein n=1 Tax=Pulveribacter sp. TaxID=2678893 RepID=UPI0028AC1B90|nr:TonB-dependent receptor [Pulveribacter sp.]
MSISLFRESAAASGCARLRASALTLAVFAVCSAQAQDGVIVVAQNLRAPSLDDVVVTATRTAQPLTDIVADVSIVDSETIAQAGATGLVDVLARLPGVEITRNGGVGNSSNVFLRGAEGRFTAVYIDGVRVDSQSTGGAVWEQIPLSQIDRIEVLRGPAAAVYGSDAMGGVIQLFTKKGEGPAAPYVGVGLGSHQLRRIEAGVSGAAGEGGAFDYALGISHERSDGYDIRDSASHNPDRDGYRTTAGNARLGLKINAAHRIDATLLANEMKSGYDGPKYTPADPEDDQNDNRMHAAGLTWSAQWSEAFSSRVSLTDSVSRYETTPSYYLTRTHLRGYLWHNEYRLGAHLFTAALERREDQLTNDPIDRDRSQDALALGYGFHAGNHTLQLNLRHDSDSEFGSKNTGSVAYGYAITPTLRATASAGTAFRAPTLYQRFSQYGDASLKPETGRNIEVGLRYASGASHAGVVAYRNRVSNLIIFDGTATACGQDFGCYNSVGRAEYKGVTLSAGHRVGGVTLHGSIDLQSPKDLATGRQLQRRAKRYATFGADTQLAGWTLGAEVQASGRRFDNAANTQVLGGYTLVNLYASTRVARDFTLLARVDNLGDKDYQLARTYVTPGRSLYVGLKWAPH